MENLQVDFDFLIENLPNMKYDAAKALLRHYPGEITGDEYVALAEEGLDESVEKYLTTLLENNM